MGNPTISTAWKYAVINAILCLASSLICAYIFRENTLHLSGWFGKDSYSTYKFGTLSYVIIALGIGSFIAALYSGNTAADRIKATVIAIYEDKITGIAVGKNFDLVKMIFFWMGWDNAKLTHFDLALNQITSVDLMGDNAIAINTPGAQYMCFVSNNYEIQTVFNNKTRNKDSQQGGSI
jgi:hypothetical protein